MVHYRGESRASFITGPCVHNTRIKRLWREVVHCILFSFKNVFLHLEQMGLLIRSNDIDLYALHYVYMPRINTALTQFVLINSLHVPLHVITVLHETFPPGVEDSNQGMNFYFQVRQFLMCYFASGF